MIRIFAYLLPLFAFVSYAHADLKCGDAPYRFGKDGLVVTWIGPVPKDAKVTYVDDDVFSSIEKQFGPEIPSDLDAKYQKDLRRVELSNAQISEDLSEATAWLKRFNIAVEKEPAKTFQDYIDKGYVIYSTLIDHPMVSAPELFVACSIVLQRGIIVMGPEHETLYLRSYFHSANDKGDFVNFAPRGGLKISFPSKAAWFPLSLTKHIFEPTSHVVLDILTQSPMEMSAPAGFKKSAGSMKVAMGAQDFHITRFTGVLKRGQDVPDFSIELTK